MRPKNAEPGTTPGQAGPAGEPGCSARGGSAMLVRLTATVLVILVGAGVTQGQGRLTPALGNQVVEGKDRLTDGDLLKLVPGPFTVETNPDGELVLTWEEVNRIHVEFSEGKVTSVSGTFSDAVASRTLTLANFKKVARGMSREEVGALLDRKPGARGQFSSHALPDEGEKRNRQVCEWAQGRRLRVHVKGGKLVGAAFTDSTGE